MPPNSISILMAQIHPRMGAIAENTQKIIHLITSNSEQDVIVFPELVLTGYPPEDWLLHQSLKEEIKTALSKIQAVSQQHVILGHPHWDNERGLFNSASVFYQGELLTRYHKQHLPNYGVFDEARYFTKGPEKACIIQINGHSIGLCICEDVWQPGPIEQIRVAGGEGVICINASPFDTEKPLLRETLLRQHAEKGLFIAYVNCVGGQDELVFDGQSLALDNQGRIVARARAFEEQLLRFTYPPEPHHLSRVTPPHTHDELMYNALCCGLRDYVQGNHFKGVLLGLSGGIDSALTLAIAVDALGAENVLAIMMPTRFTASMSQEDAAWQANKLGVTYLTLPIESIVTSFLNQLAPVWNNAACDITEENLQARIRGTLLMSMSNKTGRLLLTTGNKSEMAVGYCTLYGDMCGGFSVLKDVFKTQVYRLAHFRNTRDHIIPERVLTRPPSAELAENQTDQDSLPDYAILDDILRLYIHKRLGHSEIIQQGFDAATVHQVLHLVTRNEYKRKQAAPGVKITTCAFGRDWRYPNTSEFTP